MTLYSLLVFLHVVTAIFGLGPLAVLAVGSSGGWLPLTRTAQLLRLTGLSLLGMFITGAGLIALTHGALGGTGWVRVSFGLFLVLGFLHGMSRRQLRKAQAAAAPAAGSAFGGLLWAMCAITAVITYLMEAKPW